MEDFNFHFASGLDSIIRPQKQFLEVQSSLGYNAEVWDIWRLWETSPEAPCVEPLLLPGPLVCNHIPYHFRLEDHPPLCRSPNVGLFFK